MKFKISKKNLARLKKLGGSKWMTVESEKPLSPNKVLLQLIEDEWVKFSEAYHD